MTGPFGTLRPSPTLADLHGPGHFFSPRASPRLSEWLPQGAAALDALTGCQLAITGEMPSCVSRGVASPEALALLDEAGLAPARAPRTYAGLDEWRQILREVQAKGLRVVVQHLHPDDEIAPGSCAVPPRLLARLNSKLHLDEFVSPSRLPRRARLPRAGLAANRDAIGRLPAVAKAGTLDPTGGGIDVLVCRSAADLGRAESLFVSCDDVLLEELLPIERNLCLGFAVGASGDVVCLGASDQICDLDGRYRGNLLGPHAQAPADAVAAALEAVRAGVRHGYRGFAGVDVAVLPDGRALLYDLNFRANGSTGPLLVLAAASRGRAPLSARSGWFHGPGDAISVIAAARRAMGEGLLLPLTVFDPVAAGHLDARPALFGLVVGESRDAVDAALRRVAVLGLTGR